MVGARRIQLGRARRAVAELIRDPDQTELVFEISEALAGRQPERLVARVRSSDEGAQLLRERPEVDRSTCDLSELLTLPRGTFGFEFARWMLENRFEPGLVDFETKSADSDVEYLGRRLMQVHDFWHVLSGYNRDPMGELGILAFTYGQSHSRGIAFILLRLVVRHVAERWRNAHRPFSPLIPYLWRGYRAGRRARFLPPLFLEDYLCLPLDAVRERLRIEPLRSGFNQDVLPPIAPPDAGPDRTSIAA